jgi:hypothetical protein
MRNRRRASRLHLLSGYPFDEQLRKPSSEVLDRAFGRRIDALGGIRVVGVNRGGVDDRGAGLHVPHRSACDPEHGADVGVDGTMPLFVRDLVERRMGRLVSSIVDRHVELAEGFDRLLHDGIAMLRVGHVATR